MNVVIANSQQNELANIDVDVIKSISGTYNASEIVEMFKNFFYSKMILDVTAIKNYTETSSYEELSKGLDPEKIVFLLPQGSKLCTPSFLSNLISLGIYNFTTNVNGVKHLIKKSNTLKDVEHIQKMVSTKFTNKENNIVSDNKENDIKSNEDIKEKDNKEVNNNVSISSNINNNNNNSDNAKIIGFKNVSDHAGSTSLIYMLKKELVNTYGNDNVKALELDKNKFSLFNDKNMISAKSNELNNVMKNISNASIILVDLNDYEDDSFCNDVIYLLEPSTIKLNHVIRKNMDIFKKLSNKKVVLNQSLLSNSDVSDFEGEAGIKVFYNLPPLDDRKHNAVIDEFLVKLGLFNKNSVRNFESSRIFGLFRR